MPKNASTGRYYSGINVLILLGSVVEHGFPVQSWVTYRQALGLAGNVRKGEQGIAPCPRWRRKNQIRI
jgi:antirestriction protein ArdC